MKNYHTTHKGEKWATTTEGGSRPVVTAPTKAEVIQKTIDYMNDKTGAVKIHRLDGTIQEERTYHRKDDPTKSKG